MGGRGRPVLCAGHALLAKEIGVGAVLAPPPPKPTVQAKLAKLRHELEATRAERDEERERADDNYASYERLKARNDAIRSALARCVAVLEGAGRLSDGADGAVAQARAAIAPPPQGTN